MRKLALVAFATVLAALPVSTYAASVGVNASTTTTVKTSTANAGANTSAGVGINGSLSSTSSFSDVVGTLSTPTTSASIDLTTIHPKHVRLVLVSKLKGYSAAGLKLAKASLTNRTALDAKVAADISLTAALKKNGYLPSDVVAVSTNAQGDLVVFLAKSA